MHEVIKYFTWTDGNSFKVVHYLRKPTISDENYGTGMPNPLEP